MKDKNLNKERIKFQYIFTIALIIVYVVLGVSVFGKQEGDAWMYRTLTNNLVNGKYSSLYSSYNVHMDLEGSKDFAGPEFDRFKEFMEYYDYYIKFVIYDEYDDYINTNEHAEQKEEFFEKMEEIKDSSQYSENYPHYDYLYEYVNENK